MSDGQSSTTTGTTACSQPAPVVQVDYSRLRGTELSREKVSGLRLVVVGAGALGNEVVAILGKLGVGRMTIVDRDDVQPSNLTRSVLLRAQGADGKNKAEAICLAGRNLFPDTEFVPFPGEIADVGLGDLAGADLLFGCVDNDMARIETAYMANRVDLPVVDGGLGTMDYWRGRVSFFPNRRSACFSCLLTAERRRELLTLWEASMHPCWSEGTRLDVTAYPSTPTMASITAALQVEVGVRRLIGMRAGVTAHAETIEIDIGTLPPRMHSLYHPRSDVCPFHDAPPALVPLKEADIRRTVNDLLDSQNPPPGTSPALVLDWPVCTRAHCDGCGHDWEPMLRLGFFRRAGVCPHCGSLRLREDEVIRFVRKDSPWSTFPLARLGLPQRHLVAILFESTCRT